MFCRQCGEEGQVVFTGLCSLCYNGKGPIGTHFNAWTGKKTDATKIRYGIIGSFSLPSRQFFDACSICGKSKPRRISMIMEIPCNCYDSHEEGDNLGSKQE